MEGSSGKGSVGKERNPAENQRMLLERWTKSPHKSPRAATVALESHQEARLPLTFFSFFSPRDSRLTFGQGGHLAGALSEQGRCPRVGTAQFCWKKGTVSFGKQTQGPIYHPRLCRGPLRPTSPRASARLAQKPGSEMIAAWVQPLVARQTVKTKITTHRCPPQATPLVRCDYLVRNFSQ